jgi:hypothetical protein
MILEPSPDSVSVVSPGLDCQFSLVLVGRALAYLPYVARAVEELGQSGLGRDRVKFDLLSIIDESGIKCWIPGGQFKNPAPVNLPFRPGPTRRQKFAIKLISPLRLQVQRRISRSPTLTDIVLSLTRRLFLLRYFFGDGSIEDPTSFYLPSAQEALLTSQELVWNNHTRHSTRKNTEVPIGGLTGCLRFDGDLGVLEPLLRLGEYVHLGKNVIFGLGKISLEYL